LGSLNSGNISSLSRETFFKGKSDVEADLSVRRGVFSSLDARDPTRHDTHLKVDSSPLIKNEHDCPPFSDSKGEILSPRPTTSNKLLFSIKGFFAQRTEVLAGGHSAGRQHAESSKRKQYSPTLTKHGAPENTSVHSNS
jgi:hypothetical protein